MTRRASQPPSRALALAAATLALALAACGGEGGGAQAPAAAEPTRLESPEVGIAVEVPAGASFTAAGTEGGVLRLASEGEVAEGDVRLGPATLVYDAEPPQEAGVNLVAAINEREVEVEARPEGRFFGQGELGSHLGPAFSTRGSYVDEEGRAVEELRIFAVHPSGDRLLHMTLAYEPAPGQAAVRLQQALTAFGWIEPLPVEAEAYEGGTEAGELATGF